MSAGPGFGCGCRPDLRVHTRAEMSGCIFYTYPKIPYERNSIPANMDPDEIDFELEAYQGWTIKKYEDRPITRRAILKAALKSWFRVHILRNPRPKILLLDGTFPDDAAINGRLYLFHPDHLELHMAAPKAVGTIRDLEERT